MPKLDSSEIEHLSIGEELDALVVTEFLSRWIKTFYYEKVGQKEVTRLVENDPNFLINHDGIRYRAHGSSRRWSGSRNLEDTAMVLDRLAKKAMVMRIDYDWRLSEVKITMIPLEYSMEITAYASGIASYSQLMALAACRLALLYSIRIPEVNDAA